MIISRSLRYFSINATRQIRSIKPKIIPTRPHIYTQIMAASTAPHPVSSTAEAHKPAEGLEPVTAGASATPAPAAAGKPGKEGKAGKPKKDKAAGGSSGPLELSPAPEYFDERIKIFDEYKKKYDAEVAGMCPTSARLTLG
jgi:threonyl-tRNA synthetase